MREAVVVKYPDGSLQPATAADQEIVRVRRVGKAYRVKFTEVSDRSLQHHRLYWAGLIELVFNYWEPTGGCLLPSELKAVNGFAQYLGMMGGNTSLLLEAASEYLDGLSSSRAERLPAISKDRYDIHTWLKIEAGCYEWRQTPRGIHKVAKSINFNSMDQNEFSTFYKKALDVAWRYILHREFKNQDEAQVAIDELMAMC